MKLYLTLIALSLLISACGVKGPPLPPLKPPELSEGRKQLIQDKNEQQKDDKKND